MGKITTNLRKRMREKRYTRAQFAEICDINEETLKNYLRKDDYPTRWLKVFADKLDCTYDYLLGKSKVPERKYQDARSETGLSIQAIDNIKNMSADEMQVLNMLLEDVTILQYLKSYFDVTPETNELYIETMNGKMIEIVEDLNGMENDELPDLYVIVEIAVRTRLSNLRNEYHNKK